jgi:hypothetical protein
MFLCKQLNQKHLERILLLNGYAYTRQSQLTAWLVRAVSEKYKNLTEHSNSLAYFQPFTLAIKALRKRK